MSTSSSSSSPDNVIQTLTSMGWSFSDPDQIKALISSNPNSLESDLLNLDLRSIGSKSLPEPAAFRKLSHLTGPKVLQISSSRDITRSSISEPSDNSNDQRLLRLKLTDGHTEITAVEYSHIPSIPNDVIPGTKVRLENKAVIHNGIVCLNPKVVSFLGGIVQSLYEEWEMNKKYSGFSRSSLKSSQNGDSSGPPPFEKLQVGAPSLSVTQQGRSSKYSRAISTVSGPTYMHKGESSVILQTSEPRRRDKEVVRRENDVKSTSLAEMSEENQSSSESRPKEVSDSVPVQNQAASQKLLQKMVNQNQGGRHSGGWKQRGKGKEEMSVLTLEEWERKKTLGNSLAKHELPNVSEDEYLARQLQDQFDLEDHYVQKGPCVTEADDIRLSMFSFDREEPRDYGRTGSRGRGRGRRSGRGRGRFG